MRYIEELSWILDKPGAAIHDQEERIRENIAFVHSLGFKCDSVGWCVLPLDDPRVPEVFEKITDFCKKNGWRSRAVYTRTYVDIQSDWFELTYSFFNSSTPVERLMTDIPGVQTNAIRAFYETFVGPKRWGMELFVPERFRDACVRQHCELDFCWAKDVGKYQAEQYFHAYGRRLIPEVAVNNELNHSASRLQAAGGWLPKIAEVFHTLQMAHLPDCYLAKDLPESGIAYVYIPQSVSCVGRNTILIHRDTAAILLREGAIKDSALRPAPVVEALPGGYVWRKTQPIPRPSAAFVAQMELAYEQIKAIRRPVRRISEKEAVKRLRRARKERKADFGKAMSKSECAAVTVSPYACLIPYYQVANGGYLSDEYELLPYDRAVLENTRFYCTMEAEELLGQKPEGVVIATSADGDVILLCQNGRVLRFSHEAPEAANQWPSLGQFIAEAIQ